MSCGDALNNENRAAQCPANFSLSVASDAHTFRASDKLKLVGHFQGTTLKPAMEVYLCVVKESR